MSLHSKFKFWAFLPGVLLLPVTGLMAVIAMNVSDRPDMPRVGAYLFFVFFLFIWVWLVFGELRTKIIKAAIDNTQITVSGFFGLGARKYYLLAQFDGFETALLPSRYDTYEYLYLMKNGKKIVKLSQFYHSNYAELKSDLTNKIKNLGRKKMNLLQEIKEIFI